MPEPVNIAVLVERIFAVTYFALGVSLLLHTRRWHEIFTAMMTRPHAALPLGALSFSIGAVIVVTHNIWVADLSVVLTVIGWISLAKGLTMMLAPQCLEAYVTRFGAVSMWRLNFGGVFAIIIAVLVGAGAFGLAGG